MTQFYFLIELYIIFSNFYLFGLNWKKKKVYNHLPWEMVWAEIIDTQRKNMIKGEFRDGWWYTQSPFRLMSLSLSFYHKFGIIKTDSHNLYITNKLLLKYKSNLKY